MVPSSQISFEGSIYFSGDQIALDDIKLKRLSNGCASRYPNI